MTTQATTQRIDARSKKSSGLLVTVALGAALLALVAAIGVGPAEAREEAAAGTGKIVFVSDRTRGEGVVNPQGDIEIFIMNPNGANPKQLTANAVDDENPTLSPDGQKVAYESSGKQTSNLESDYEVYTVNSNGTGKKNLTNNAEGVHDFEPVFSPDGQRIAFTSYGAQNSNPEGDHDVYTINADGSALSNFTFISGSGVHDSDPVFSPDGLKIAFTSYGKQPSNPGGDAEVYRMNANGLGQTNLTNNGVFDLSHEWGR